ncbi:hypothetical protein GIB67_013811 [Kingdonia uniflora]|uniref:Pentatricopeptide repeat-containing protein n=1 Tax=Kingdonia uniflora TaxID=39325 RepID=A0A7J7N7S6_9MAGN|nr:hypothetical protein GIB67_013811 [Kingdonia uniflora]
MKEFELTPDKYSYTIVIGAICQRGNFNEAIGMLDEMEKNEAISIHTHLYYLRNYFEWLYNKCELLLEGEEIWSRMENGGVAPDIQYSSSSSAAKTTTVVATTESREVSSSNDDLALTSTTVIGKDALLLLQSRVFEDICLDAMNQRASFQESLAFIIRTLCGQEMRGSVVLSAECVDGPATILTPKHYGKCYAILSDLSSAKVHLCYKEFRSNRVKLFDVSKLRGYFEQTILSCLEEEFKFSVEGTMQGAKRSRNCKRRQ